jgi:uncharacterized membrane protein YhiD involved in acid resistance
MTAALDWLRFGSAPGFGVTPTSVLFDLLLAFVLGQVVAWMYIFTHRGLSYSRNMVHSIVLLAMIVTAVMLVVGDSVARAFGLVGALAIIRFRTVVRDARDTSFIFLSLAMGIAIGAQHYSVAIIGVILIGLAAVHMHFTGFAQRHADTGVLRVRSAGTASVIEETVASWCRTHELLALKEASNGESEYSFEIRLYHPGEREDLVNAVKKIPGTSNVSVALEERAEEW